MDIVTLLTAKPVLIGLHLGFAILGIDAFLWLLGEVIAKSQSVRRQAVAASIGLFGYFAAWIIGGYYYVKFYGKLVKPEILSGSAPWAHAIAMEVKEHVFLFAVPTAIAIYFLSKLSTTDLANTGLRKHLIILTLFVVGLGFSAGLMGFIISAAARWGA